MWLFSSNGFASVVADSNDPKKLLVRGRVEGHIQALFSMAEVLETPEADYRFRTSLSRDRVKEVVADKFAAISYDNFKGSIGNRDYHNACMGVWSAMHRLQGKANPPYV